MSPIHGSWEGQASSFALASSCMDASATYHGQRRLSAISIAASQPRTHPGGVTSDQGHKVGVSGAAHEAVGAAIVHLLWRGSSGGGR